MKKLAYLLILLIPIHVSASEEDHEQIAGMIDQLTMLHQVGVSMKVAYDFNDIDELRACVKKHSKFRDQAKSLQQQVRTLKAFTYRLDMTYATDAAFVCVYCGGESSAKRCAEMPEHLHAMKQRLKEDGYK